MSGKFYKNVPQAAVPNAGNQSIEQTATSQPNPPPTNSRSNSITPAPSDTDSKNEDPFEDAFNSLSPSRTSSPIPSHPKQEKIQQEKSGTKPAKKPLILKKTVPKKDPFIGNDWGDVDNNSMSLKSTKETNPPPSKPKQTFEIKETVDDAEDWETNW